jgi:hypothetical protein
VAAGIWEHAADELDADEQERAAEGLSIAQAVDESGYKGDSLRRLIAEGKLDDVGADGKPLIRRRDLPRKPRHRRSSRTGDPDLAGDLLRDQGIEPLGP